MLIGAGIPLFGSLPRDVKLRHVGTREYKSGVITSEYDVIDQAPTFNGPEQDAARCSLKT